MTKQTGEVLRGLLGSEFGFISGRYPDRVAPAHIANAFVCELFGSGKQGGHLTKLEFSSDRVAAHDLVLEDPENGLARAALAESVQVVLNADARSFKGFPAYLSLDASLATPNPSDYGFGTYLARSISPENRTRFLNWLAGILDSSRSSDAVSRFTSSLVASIGDVAEPQTAIDHDRTVLAPLVDSLLGTLLRSDGASGAGRIDKIQRLTTLLSFTSVLAQLVEPLMFCRAHPTGSEDVSNSGTVNVSDLVVLVCFTATPPGGSTDEVVRLSSETLRHAIFQSHKALCSIFVSAYSEFVERYEADAIKEFLCERLSGQSQAEALRFIENIKKGFPDLDWNDGSQVFGHIFTQKSLLSGIRPLGTKIGVLAPSRGAGTPRVVMDARLLETLVSVLVHEECRFDELVDRFYLRFGMLVGRAPSLPSDGLKSLVAVAGRTIDVERCLDIAQQRFRDRLVDCGFAKKFSDGTTIVRPL